MNKWRSIAESCNSREKMVSRPVDHEPLIESVRSIEHDSRREGSVGTGGF
jgi:hypothetical protein